MQLSLESGANIENPTTAHLALIEGEEFAILGDGGDSYLQCAKHFEVPGQYALEYQAGSLDEHFSAVDGAVDGAFELDRVKSAFGKYLRGDSSWKTDFKWEKMDLG